jgi:hypothetical protein
MINTIKRLAGLTGVKPPSSTPLVMPDQDLPYASRAGLFVKALETSYRQGRSSKNVLGSMTTPNELIFLDRYARDFYAGKGKIVDLGCWLGATTAALADGLIDGPYAGRERVVESYDLFEWDDWMNPIKEAIGARLDFATGQCFYDHVKSSLERYGRLISVHKADLSAYRPPDEWMIEFLFVDAMKNWDLAHAIAANFFPQLMSGESLVVQQDFAFYDPIVSTNHLLMWHLREYFEPLHHVPDSCSMVFLTTKAPDAGQIPAYTHNYFGEDEVEEAYRYCLPLVQDSMRTSLLVAKLCHGLMCHQQRTVSAGVEELKGHKLSGAMQDTVARCAAKGYGPPPEGWGSFILDIKPKLAHGFIA